MVKKMSILNALVLVSIGVAPQKTIARRHTNNGAKIGNVPSQVQMAQSPLDAETIVLNTKAHVLRGLQSFDKLMKMSSDAREEMLEGLRAYVKSQKARVNPAHMEKVLPMQKMDYQKHNDALSGLVTDLKGLEKVRHNDKKFENKLGALRKKLGGTGNIIKRKLTENELQAEVLRQLKQLCTTFKSPAEDLRDIREEIIEGAAAYVKQYIRNNKEVSDNIKKLRRDLDKLADLAERKDVNRFKAKLQELKTRLGKTASQQSWFKGWF